MGDLKSLRYIRSEIIEEKLGYQEDMAKEVHGFCMNVVNYLMENEKIKNDRDLSEKL